MKASPAKLLQHLSRSAPSLTADPASDAVLLAHFTSRRDEAAFTVLVRRHGPMVLRLCRRVLGNAHDAEDAFQATFLVLARKASAIRRRNHLAAWLHGVAHRLALKARVARARRRCGQVSAPTPEPADPQPDPLTRMTARELLTALDEELQRLPPVYRLPLVLCCLEGRTQEEAARQLGWTPGSVKGRLERGKARLHARLSRRGLSLSAALLALDALHGPAAASVPAALLTSTARMGLLFAAGVRNAGEVSAPAVALAEGVLKTMLLNKLRIVACLLVLAVVLGAGTGMFVFGARAGDGAEERAAKAPAPPRPKAKTPEEKKAMTDLDLLQGTWVAVSCEANGKAQPDVVRKGFRLTIEGNRFTMGQELGPHFPHGTCTLDPEKQPKTIDFVQSYGLPLEKPMWIRGIYQLNDGTLKICRAVSGGKRPTAFTTKPGSGRELLVFRRPAARRAKQNTSVPNAWSEPVKGISGRLRIGWLRQGDTIRPEVTAELKNVQPAKSLAVSNRFLLEARVRDQSGKEIKVEPMITDATALVPEQWGVVPAGAYLGYPADLRCTGSEAPPRFPRDKAVVLVLAGMQWRLPPGRYLVTARLMAPAKGKKLPPPPGVSRWDGTLALPPVEVVVPAMKAKASQ